MTWEKADWLVFQVGEQRWALAAGCVRQVMRPPPITCVPGASPDCAGLMGWQGRLLTVVDAAARLSPGSAREFSGERVVLWVQEDHAGGLLVDGVVGLRRLPTSAALPLQSMLPPPWNVVAGLLRDGDDIVPILEPSAWFSAAGGEVPAGAQTARSNRLP